MWTLSFPDSKFLGFAVTELNQHQIPVFSKNPAVRGPPAPQPKRAAHGDARSQPGQTTSPGAVYKGGPGARGQGTIKSSRPAQPLSEDDGAATGLQRAAPAPPWKALEGLGRPWKAVRAARHVRREPAPRAARAPRRWASRDSARARGVSGLPRHFRRSPRFRFRGASERGRLAGSARGRAQRPGWRRPRRGWPRTGMPN